MASGRLTRYTGRQTLRSVTHILRCFDCGREPKGTAVGIRQTPGGAVGYAGLESCGRVWLCPVCNSKVMARRALEIGSALVWARSADLHIIWGSLTLRHNRFDYLEDLLDIQRDAWRYVVSDWRWRAHGTTSTIEDDVTGDRTTVEGQWVSLGKHTHDAACDRGCRKRKSDPVFIEHLEGRVGYIRAAELTDGANGWHPHFHPIILFRGSREAAQEFADLVVDLWVEGVEASGGEARGEGAQQLKVLEPHEVFENLSQYVTKATYETARADTPSKLALETVWSQGKVGRGRALETRSHWSLLGDLEDGDQAQKHTARVKWLELEEAVTGHRMITWSRGLRTFAGLGLEQDDEEVAAEEVGTANDTLCFITAEGWAGIRDRPDVVATLLDMLETGGWDALKLSLELHNVEYFTLVPAEA